MQAFADGITRRGALAGALAIAACGGSTLTEGGDGGRGEGSSAGSSTGASSSHHSSSQAVPMYHRANGDLCTQPAGPGFCASGGPADGTCTMDSECAMGPNGRCIEPLTGGPFCSCTYDTCADDAACPSGNTCACHDSPYSEGGNTCVPGNCRVDPDCGVRGYCSPSPVLNCAGGVAGYYCHTPNDQCVNASDCPVPRGGAATCVYSTTSMLWKCQPVGACE